MANVTLLGTPSAGGSAFTQDVTLGTTPLRLRIGSMVSFQADGRLFDGNGVRPDVVVEAAPEYYIGGRDNVLEEGVRRVMGRTERPPTRTPRPSTPNPTGSQSARLTSETPRARWMSARRLGSTPFS